MALGQLCLCGLFRPTLMQVPVAQKTLSTKGHRTMKIKFTDPAIRSLKETGNVYGRGDSEHKGLMVRVSASGAKTFQFAYHSKTAQKTRFLTFGQYPQVTLADAFARYKVAAAAIANGEDPQADKVEERA